MFEPKSSFENLFGGPITNAIFREIGQICEYPRGKAADSFHVRSSVLSRVKRAAFVHVKRRKILRLSVLRLTTARFIAEIAHFAPRHARCTLGFALSTKFGRKD
jgi:hypothetical protein